MLRKYIYFGGIAYEINKNIQKYLFKQRSIVRVSVYKNNP